MRIRELLEALSQTQAKYYLKQWNEEWSDEIYEPLFGTKWRIYIPLEGKTADATSEVRNKIEKYLNTRGYSIKSYRGNLAVDSSGKERGLSKMLPPELLKLFQEDPVRSGSKIDKNTAKYQIVISRHPYDIAGMSTDRGWVSCMTLKHTDKKTGEEVNAGCNQHIVAEDVQAGTLIAYLITMEDRNIENPVARILIKPYFNEHDGLLLSTKVSKVYVDAPPIFKTTVDAWVDEANEQLEAESGTYHLPQSLYVDDPNYDRDEDGPATIDYEGAEVNKNKRLEREKIEFLTKSIKSILANISDPDLRSEAFTELFDGKVTYNDYLLCVQNRIWLHNYMQVSDSVIIEYILKNPRSMSQLSQFENESVAVRRACVEHVIANIKSNRNYYNFTDTLPENMIKLMTDDELYVYVRDSPNVRISSDMPFEIYARLAADNSMIAASFKLTSDDWDKLISVVPDVAQYKSYSRILKQ